MHLVRLQKYIADCGVCSRRNAEVLIDEGRVLVNGRQAMLGQKVDADKDAVKLDGKRLFMPAQNKLVVYALYKPKMCVSTLFDPQRRETIAKFIPKNAPRIYPVGRLDYDTEGLMLLTNDGKLADNIMHPRYNIWKVYLVKISGFISQDDANQIRAGFNLRGKMTAACKIKEIHKLTDKSWVELSLREGRKHQIKIMFAHFGHDVLKIKRVKIATVSLADMVAGQCRLLNLKELNTLKKHLAAADLSK